MLTRSLQNFVPVMLASLMLNGCATRLNYDSPSTVDLTGTWVLDSKLSQVVIFPAAKSSGKRARPQGGGREGNQRGGGRPDRSTSKSPSDRSSIDKNAAVASEMVIEQAVDSMGVMYQNGKYREVDWGKVERRNITVISGWADETLVIKSKGSRATLTEFYTLNAHRDVLTIQFNIADGEYFRVYNRKKSLLLNK